MTLRTDGKGDSLPSLDSRFSHGEVSMSLTMCGLLVEKAEQLSRLYARHRDWTVVEGKWETERYDERSTRDSSKKIYRVLSSRFKTAGSDLPAITKLPSIFDQCANHRDKAQVLYFYLLEDDPLVKYTIHRYAERMRQMGVDGLDFEQDTIENLLSEFHYDDGSEFDYAESTTRRWGEGLRSVMREIEVLETQQALHGKVPNVGIVPLLVAAGYSWENDGTDWLKLPIGWLYLFQPEQYWNSLAERLSDHPSWESSGIHGELRLQPVAETYGWAESLEDDE